MKRFLGFFLCVFSIVVAADRLDVLQIDDSGDIKYPTGVSTVSFGSEIHVGGANPAVVFDGSQTGITGAGYVTNGVVVAWPAPSTNSTSFSTTAYVDDSIATLWGVLSIAGRADIYNTYTNNPPNSLSNLASYVEQALAVLACVAVQPDLGTISNRLDRMEAALDVAAATNKVQSLEQRTTAAEEKLESIKSLGNGTEELDFILEFQPDSMNMVQMAEAFRALAKYIKYGTTNDVAQ